ncbi:uncharacterized protein LOC134277484 [Saccostrea cucullata]|uniref:uncharacterized protein LOC134277484 n=1 Tax=Saccostrea cuccullata TaxID=36930 RepID=UPI002ED01B4D
MNEKKMISAISMCLIILFRRMETKKMIDIDNIKFNLPCGNNYCEGIRQYCSEEQTCLYCTRDICMMRNPPDLCVFQCASYKNDIDSKNTNHTRSARKEDLTEHMRVCVDKWVIILLGVTVGVSIVINCGILMWILIIKRNQGEKYYFDDCFIICRKRNIHELLRKYHTTEKQPESP